MDNPLKELHGKKKIDYIWTYYKPVVFGILLALILLTCWIVWMVHPPAETVLTLMVVDSPVAEPNAEEAFPGFSETLLESSAEQIEIDVTMHFLGKSEQLIATNLQVLTARFLSGEIDLFAADTETSLKFGDNGAFVNPEEYLTEEEQKVLEPWYVRNSTGIPIGISLDGSEKYLASGLSAEGTVLSMVIKCRHPEAAHNMVEYLFDLPYQEE